MCVEKAENLISCKCRKAIIKVEKEVFYIRLETELLVHMFDEPNFHCIAKKLFPVVPNMLCDA